MFKIMFLYMIIVFHVFAWGQSPGDSIGTTWYDMQSNHSYGQRLFVDAYGNVHVNWMKMNQERTIRFCAWNFRDSGGGYFGETQASPSWSGWVQLDVMRDGSERTIIAYHHDAGSGYWSWIDIDSANGAGHWPNDPKALQIADYLWPKITVCNNNNILMATGDFLVSSTFHYVFLTTDFGDTWNEFAAFDSCSNLTFFLRASRTSGSNKAAFVHTRFITDTIASAQLDQDIWYMLSYDNGETWTPLINLTDYQPYPTDSVRAYCDVNAVFDGNDDLHVVWAGRRVDIAGYYNKSKIFHWDELNDTITVINSPSIYYSEPGGWWTSPYGFGSFRMPADRPELIMDTISGYIYCIWHGNDDYFDTSAAGYPNGELFGSFSTDNGITWADYVNLTNTRSPGAPPGACLDEDYATVHPYVVNDSIYVTYIEDKDAGNCADAEGTFTENPVRCWVFHKNLITGIEEEKSYVVENYDLGPTIFKGPLLLPKNRGCRIFDITGRVVVPSKIKPGIYFIEIDGQITKKVVKVK